VWSSVVTKLVLVGAAGRMGTAIMRLAPELGLHVVGGIVAEGEEQPAGDVPFHSDWTADFDAVDVIVDFSTPSGAAHALELSRAHNKPLVSGSTGLTESFRKQLEQASAEIPVLHASNMSIGVQLLLKLIELSGALVPESFQPEIVELHHGKKEDAPSGTAWSMKQALEAGAGRTFSEVCGRSGRVGEREQNELGFHAVRGGDVPGEHTLYLFGSGERIELSHRALSRDIFARGALTAAKWIVGKPAGRYQMADVLSEES